MDKIKYILSVFTSAAVDSGETKIAYIVGVILLAIRIAIPVILIVIASFDLVKAMTQNDEREMKKVITGILPKVVSAIIVFLIPSLVSLVLTLVNQGNLLTESENCLLHPFECNVELWNEQSSYSSNTYSSKQNSSSSSSTSSSNSLNTQNGTPPPPAPIATPYPMKEYFTEDGICQLNQRLL